ncbi:MAG: DUF4252 domain-containing protein [Bacteroidaceae bacterium]|nr:DUF4252 domain-containing protein [Bacteroidaceae bacterium]
MKTFIQTLIFLLTLSPAWTLVANAHTAPKPAVSAIQSTARPKVAYSFDYLASNKKVTRFFVSEEMLSIAKSELLKSNSWEFSHIVDRLSSILTTHTHSQSATSEIRKSYEEIATMEEYELLMQFTKENAEIIVFGVRGKGRELKELLIFRFRDNYCSRIVQLTGKLTTDDIGKIIKLNRKK